LDHRVPQPLFHINKILQVILEGINTVENSVVKFLFPQIVPDMLHGVELRRIWRKAEQFSGIREVIVQRGSFSSLYTEILSNT